MDLPARLLRFQDLFEKLPVDPHDGASEHGDQSPVGVESETLIACLHDESVKRGVIESEVQHRVHHSGHGKFRSRTDGKEERIFRIPELRPHRLLHLLQVGKHLFPHAGWIFLLVPEVRIARLGGDGESGGNGNLQVHHIRQARPFPAQQVPHLSRSVGFSVPKKINIPFRGSRHQRPPE